MPEDVIRSLGKRRVVLWLVTDAYLAMARVCRRGDDEPVVLLLVEPSGLADAADVVAAVKRYAPRTACWWYGAGANPRLRQVVEEDMERWAPRPAVAKEAVKQPPAASASALRLAGQPVRARSGPPQIVTRPAGPSAPALSLAGEGTLPRQAEPQDTGAAPQPGRAGRAGMSSLLTEEELTMLLADDIDGGSAGGGGSP